MSDSSIRGAHPVIRAIVSVAARIAASDVNALIVGEHGTGKELLARHIHQSGREPEAAFVRLDCQDLAERALVVDLCNSANGNGNGAVHGALARARGGTLFVDHLDCFDVARQIQVLSTVLHSAASVRVRVLAAADVNGSGRSIAAVELGLVEIPVPALRQRRSDIPVLVRYFLDLYADRHGVAAQRVETAAMVALWQYDWPGNVRELESVVERIVVLGRGDVIHCRDLPAHIAALGQYRVPDPPRRLVTA
jgi:DNA-binding NtrC family response regulator